MNNIDVWETALSVWNLSASEIYRLSHTIPQSTLYKCIDCIAQCKGRIITFGVGTSGIVARKIAHSLSCIEYSAFFISPTEAEHGDFGVTRLGDLAILISNSGSTAEILRIVPFLKSRGLYLIGITRDQDTPLGQISNLVIPVCVKREADPFDMLATTSALAVLAVFDAVCVALMKLNNYTKERFEQIHPGGVIGKK